jgi:hypothetical protein
MYRAAGVLLLETFSRFEQSDKNIFVGDREFCFPYKELMRIGNYTKRLVSNDYIKRLVSKPGSNDALPIRLLVSEITDFERRHARMLAELEYYCSTTRARDNDIGENDDDAKRFRASRDDATAAMEEEKEF